MHIVFKNRRNDKRDKFESRGVETNKLKIQDEEVILTPQYQTDH